MEEIKVRYGESFNITVEMPDDDEATIATLYVGKPGQNPVITIPAEFGAEGIAHITGLPEDTRIPIGEYQYQINVLFSDDTVYKYPTEEWCASHDGLPSFIVLEALDENEVVS
jgi:hypothetical protein